MEETLAYTITARDRASDQFNKVGDAADRNRSKFSKWGKAASAAGLVVGAALLKFGKDSVAAYTESEQAQAQLQDAFRKFPSLADTSIERLQSLNSELAKKTKFDDDATASGQAVLAQFKLSGKQIEQLTPLMQDYAAKTGKDLPTAAKVLGKALLGKGRSLADVGIKFKDAGDVGKNFDQIVGGLRTQVGGFAQKEGKTAAGQSAILKNQFGELQEQAGAKLVPALTALARQLLKVIDFVSENQRVIVPVVAVLGTFAGAVYTVITAKKIWTATQKALNLALTMNPIGIVVVALAALAAGAVIAYQKSETFRAVVKGAFDGVKTAGEGMWNALKASFRFITNAFLTVAGTIIDGAARAFGWIPGIGGKLKDAAEKFHAFKDRVNNAIDGVRNDVTVAARIKGGDAAINKIARLKWELDRIPRSVTVGVINKISNIPMNARGTRNFAGGLSWVGEEGPELVSLPRGTDIYSHEESMAMFGPRGGTAAAPTAAGGSTQPLIVQLMLDGRVVQQSLLRLKRTNGMVELGLA